MTDRPSTALDERSPELTDEPADGSRPSDFDDPFEHLDEDASRSGYYRYQHGKGIVFVPYTNRITSTRS